MRALSIATMVVAGLSLSACDPAPQPSATKVPTPSERPVEKSPGLSVAYSAKRLNEIFGRAPLMDTAVFYGHAYLRALTYKDVDCPKVFENTPYEPTTLALDFRVPPRDDGADWLVFSAIIGPVKVGAGEIVTADSDDIIILKDEPMYWATQGYAIMGGYRPVARGKRSRAGAPGTQFALEIDGDIDRYYLLNKTGSHTVTVIAKNNRIDLKSRDKYIEVGADDTAKFVDIKTADPNDPRLKFRDAMWQIADCAKLQGK